MENLVFLTHSFLFLQTPTRYPTESLNQNTGRVDAWLCKPHAIHTVWVYHIDVEMNAWLHNPRQKKRITLRPFVDYHIGAEVDAW